MYNSYFLIIYKPLSLIISPWTFSTQLGASTAWFCLSQCAIPFCTLSAPDIAHLRMVPAVINGVGEEEVLLNNGLQIVSMTKKVATANKVS